MAERDASLTEIIRRHLDIDFIACQNADAVFAHLARGVSQHFVAIVEFDAEHSVGQNFGNNALEFEEVFFGHKGASISLVSGIGAKR